MFVAVVHVAADADGAFGGEARFARFFAAHVVEDAPLVDEQGVGDDLFEVGVGLRGGPWGKEIVFAREECREVVLHVEVQALEGSELLEEGTPHDKDHFIGHMEGSVAGNGAGFNAESGVGNISPIAEMGDRGRMKKSAEISPRALELLRLALEIPI